MPAAEVTPRREVICAEALAWMREHRAEPHTSVVTSLPDVSELPHLTLEAWREWFVSAVRAVVEWLPADGVAIFFQSDVRHRGVWIDKGYLVLRGAEATGAVLVWHKIVCRKPPGTATSGRASYSHLLCLTRELQPAFAWPGADVLPSAGLVPTRKGMGVAACQAACTFLQRRTSTQLVVDPFCGGGTLLAVANALGMDALGVDLSRRAVRKARKLVIALGAEAAIRAERAAPLRGT